MIAVDTNVLIYAHHSDAEWHERAATLVRELAEGRSTWGIPWPCLHESLAVVTHPRIYDPSHAHRGGVRSSGRVGSSRRVWSCSVRALSTGRS